MTSEYVSYFDDHNPAALNLRGQMAEKSLHCLSITFDKPTWRFLTPFYTYTQCSYMDRGSK
jgi:hypothetical protein